jgi:hypothetical protein
MLELTMIKSTIRDLTGIGKGEGRTSLSKNASAFLMAGSLC